MDRDGVAHFDLERLFADVDRERRRRELSWAALAREVGVSASTIRRFESADDAEADGVLTVVAWLDSSPEEYITNGCVRGRRLSTVEGGFVRVDLERVAARRGDPTLLTRRTRMTIQSLVEAAQLSRVPVAELTRATAM